MTADVQPRPQCGRHFEPADEKEHERGNLGYPVDDRCANCGRPFMDHHNGICPKH